MISRNPALPGVLAAALLLATPVSVSAAEAGAWDNFNTIDNVNAWLVYDDYFLRTYYLSFDPGETGDGIGFHYARFDFYLWLFTHPTNLAGGGKLVGDYASANIQSVIADVYIASPEDLYSLECVVFANGPMGEDYYFSLPYLGEDFSGPGWYTLRFSFDLPWVYFGGEEPETVTIDTQLLSDIQELGFYYTPMLGTPDIVPVGIDNVKLEPKMEEPVVTTSVTAEEFTMSFIPGDGVMCSIEQMLPDNTWEIIGAHFDLTGTEPYVFTTPVLRPEGKEFFRVNYDAVYTPFVTPPLTP